MYKNVYTYNRTINYLSINTWISEHSFCKYKFKICIRTLINCTDDIIMKQNKSSFNKTQSSTRNRLLYMLI